MKKVLSFFAALLLMTTSLNANSYEDLNNNKDQILMKQIDCISLALDVGDAYEDAGYSYYESWQASNWAYEGCVANGGHPGD